jgi:hypothetical protein
MRTTLTIDDDNAVRLERLRKARDLSLKDVVNDVLRRGLQEAEKPVRSKEPFKTTVFHDAQPTFQSQEEFEDLVERIQLEDDLAMLKRSGGIK